ncbi:hypothetical protein E2542_SST01255 [Spatholobus suberectus]|nr:hypothetical protein E2542_SST01255 [Spatholobus suberectus]
MITPLMKRILEMVEAEQAGKGSNHGGSNYGTSSSFNNHGNGAQDFSGAMINSGYNTGNRNSHHTSNHHGDRVINNSGNFHGNGNGGFIEGGFDSSTRNYYGGRYH